MSSGRRTSFAFCGGGSGVAFESSNKTKYCRSEAGLAKSWVQAMASALCACCVQALPLHAGTSKADDSGKKGPQCKGYDNTNQGTAI